MSASSFFLTAVYRYTTSATCMIMLFPLKRASWIVSLIMGSSSTISERKALSCMTIGENDLRREGCEFMIGPPKVINRKVNGKKPEPFEVKSVELLSWFSPLNSLVLRTVNVLIFGWMFIFCHQRLPAKKQRLCFLKYETKEQAIAAIEALNGVHKMEGSASALVVKWADTEKERQARKVQKAQAVSSPPIPGQQPSTFGADLMGSTTLQWLVLPSEFLYIVTARRSLLSSWNWPISNYAMAYQQQPGMVGLPTAIPRAQSDLTISGVEETSEVASTKRRTDKGVFSPDGRRQHGFREVAVERWVCVGVELYALQSSERGHSIRIRATPTTLKLTLIFRLLITCMRTSFFPKEVDNTPQI